MLEHLAEGLDNHPEAGLLFAEDINDEQSVDK